MLSRISSRSIRAKLLTLVCLTMLSLASVVPTRAFTSAFFHTQSVGNRGTDVKVIQYLLNVTPDGAFGPATETAVKNFQTSRGLTADGIVGPATWDRLIVTVQNGSSGNAVKAVQLMLNEKRYAGLPVDGVFGGGTESAVKTFQSHAGLTPDGVVGPLTWKNLVWHYEQPNVGGSSLCAYLTSAKRWGTAAANDQLERAAAAFFATGNGPVAVGNMSLEHGGDIDPHSSHEVGLDVDVRPIVTSSANCTTPTTWQSSSYDRAATRQLIQAIRNNAPGHVKAIFFNDPQLISEGLTINVSGHDDHLHIRYCEKVHSDPSYVC